MDLIASPERPRLVARLVGDEVTGDPRQQPSEQNCSSHYAVFVLRSAASNAGPPCLVDFLKRGPALLQQPSLLQQPRHQLIQPSFRLDENILLLDHLYVLLAKLDSWEFTRWLRVPFCFVKLSGLVFATPPAIRALYGKFSRQTQRAVHRNFARARRTAHAAQNRIGFDDFPEYCHGGLLSCLRGLSGCPLH